MTSIDTSAQLRRFLALEDVLVGFSDGIEHERLEAGLTWAKHGGAITEPLIRLFAAPWIAAAEEADWKGDAEAEALKELEALAAQPSAGAQGYVTDEWAERFCEAINWSPDGQECKVVEGEMRCTPFREIAKGHILAVIATDPHPDATPAQPGDVAALREGGYSLQGEALEMVMALEAEATRQGRGKPTDVPGIHKTLWSAAQRIRLADEAEWWSTIGKAQLAALSKRNAPTD